jgi:hypothetical protein
LKLAEGDTGKKIFGRRSKKTDSAYLSRICEANKVLHNQLSEESCGEEVAVSKILGS